MTEIIRIGSIELRFLLNRHETGDSLDFFEMEVAPLGRMPVAHYHRDWHETIYGLSGTMTFVANEGAASYHRPGRRSIVPDLDDGPSGTAEGSPGERRHLR